jgi:hypothetical protein
MQNYPGLPLADWIVKQAFHTILGLALSLDAKSLWVTYNASNCSILSVLWLSPCVELPLGHRGQFCVRVWTKQTGVLLTGQPIIYSHVTTFTVACNYAYIAPLHQKCHKRISSAATYISHKIRVKRKPATTSRHLYEIAEKTPQTPQAVVSILAKQKKHHRMSAVITLWVSFTEYQTITFIMTS